MLIKSFVWQTALFASFFSTFVWAVPSNDTQSTAITIGSLPFSNQQTTADATSDETKPFCSNSSGSSVWYEYTPTSNQLLNIDTFGSNYDTVLSVFTDKEGGLAEVFCNDDFKEQIQSQLQVEVNQNTAYYIVVNGYQSATGNLSLNLQPIQTMTNDNLSDAIVIDSLPFSFSQTTEGATAESKETSGRCAPSSASVWYEYTPLQDEKVVLSTLGSNYRTVLSVWTGNHFPLQEIACAENQESRQSQVNLTMMAGTTYRIGIEGMVPIGDFFGEQGNLVLSANAPPSNDNVSDAIEITSLPYSHTQSTSGASMEAEETFASCSQNGSTVWFKYTPDSDRNVSFSTMGSTFDTVLTLSQGNSTHPLTEIACNDDAVTNEDQENGSQLSLPVKAGETYYVSASGLFDEMGSLLFTVKEVAYDLIITQQPQGKTIEPGSVITLTVNATGTQPLSYQWYQGMRDDTSMPVGTNSKTFKTPQTQATTNYWVRITNPTGSIDSDNAFLFVDAKQNSTGVTPLGNMLIPRADFNGKVMLTGQTNAMNQVSESDNIAVEFQIDVDSEHVGQRADLVMFVDYENDGMHAKFMRQGNTWMAWDGEFGNLAIAQENVSLQNSLSNLSIFEGELAGYPGKFDVYLGYRLQNSGNIIYNQLPLSFIVE